MGEVRCTSGIKFSLMKQCIPCFLLLFIFLLSSCCQNPRNQGKPALIPGGVSLIRRDYSLGMNPTGSVVANSCITINLVL